MPHSRRLFSPICLTLLLGAVAPVGAQSICASPAGEGNVTGAGGVLNTYYPAPAGSTSLAAGSNQIPVGGARGASKTIVAGDLLLIIQMQGAAINTTNTSAYGQVTSGNAGAYEFAVATGAVSGGSVPVRGQGTGSGLLNSYSTSDASAAQGQGQARYQVIRVPQYGNLSLSGSVPVTASPWNGQSGGVVALDVTGQLNWNGGGVDLAGRGFRGGGGQLLMGAGAATAYVSSDYRTPSSADTNGNKGEGFAGTPKYTYDPLVSTTALTVGSAEGYPGGSRARGAPANAGGGGNDGRPTDNDQNSGGGGGGSGGSGGRGGNSWSSNLTVGGVGGAATPSSLSRLFLGGGGGSGARNNSSGLASSGGSGGGLLIVRAGSSAGTGSVNVSGGVGVIPDNDGGGGAGGTAVLLVGSGSLNGLTLTANGGNGTNADPAGVKHGPGGGGGGGVVYTNASGATTAAAQGTGGTTTAADAFGALPGAVGTIPGSSLTGVSGLREGAACPVLSVVKTTSTPAPWRGAKATYNIVVSNTGGPSSTVRVQDALPAGLTRRLSDTPTVTPASSRMTSADASTTTALDLRTFKLAYGESMSVTFDAQTPTDPAYRGTTFQNSATVTTLDAADNTLSFTYNAAISVGEDVRPLYPSLKLTKSVRNVSADNRAGGQANFSATAGGLPGETLECCVVYLNDGDGPLGGITVNDSIPGNATAMLGSYGISPCKGVQLTVGGTVSTYTSADDSATVPTDIGALSQAGGMKLVVGTLAKDATGTVCFRVKIN